VPDSNRSVSNLNEVVSKLLTERDEQHDDEWLREQLAGLSMDRRTKIAPLLDDTFDELDVPGEFDVTVRPDGVVRDREYDAEWDADFDGWSGRSKPQGTSQEGGFLRRFKWRYQGKLETWEMEVPGPLFKYYTERYRTRNFGVYISDPFDRPFLTALANRVRSFGDELGLSERERINAAVRFVQSLEYSPDDVTTGQIEYPKYPIETLVHDGGDCEDTSILLGALLQELGCDVAPIVLPNHHHMILGVSPNMEIDGSYYEHEGTRYYTVEATGHGWDIGDVPRQYQNASANIYPVGTNPILVHSWDAKPADSGGIIMTVNVANFGDVAADDLGIYAEFEDENESIVARPRLCRTQTIVPSQSEMYQTEISLPDNRQLRGKCVLTLGHKLHDASTSAWNGT